MFDIAGKAAKGEKWLAPIIYRLAFLDIMAIIASQLWYGMLHVHWILTLQKWVILGGLLASVVESISLFILSNINVNDSRGNNER
jgi:hypothetical protein